VPFPDPKQRAMHFKRHGSDFGAIDEHHYERLADAFMTAPLHPNLHEGIRTSGTRDRIRLNALTRHCGIAYGVLSIRTYFVKDAYGIALRGGAAGFVAFECAKVM